MTLVLQGPSLAVNLLHYASVPLKNEHFYPKFTHPAPLVIQMGLVALPFGMKASHSASVVASLLSVHALALQGVVSVASLEFQQIVFTFPLNLAQVA
jgi:hypothetical protein